MPGNNVALDTNCAILILNGDAHAIAWAGTLSSILLPVAVIAELRFGALKSARRQENLRRLAVLVQNATPLPISAATADAQADLRFALRKSGMMIPENDLWIAATCIEHHLPLCTGDSHFSHVQGLNVLPLPN